MKNFLILAVILVVCVNSNPITDALDFNKFWFGDLNIRNQVKLEWSRSGSSLHFKLTFPKLPNTVKNIQDVVFLRRETNSRTYITQFNPTRSTPGGKIKHEEYISISTYDTKNGPYAGCTRANVAGSPDVQSQTCHGFLAFIHGRDGGNRNKRFFSGLDLALARWNFFLQVNFNLKVEDDVDLKVKTKVEDLPCANCDCPDDCELDVAFKLDHKLCNGPTKASCTRTNKEYVFGDTLYIYFFLDATTRKLTPHQIHATSSKDSTGAELPLNYIEANHIDEAGEHLLSLPVAGPASEAGLQYNLKFTFRLESLARRFLEDASDRVLEAKKKNKPKVAVTNVQDISAAGIPKKKTLQDQINENNNPELQKIYNLCLAVIGVVALTCVCATVSNLVPLFKKRSYAEIPNQGAKSTA